MQSKILETIVSQRDIFTRLCCSLLFALGSASIASMQDRPNILLVMADDMGFSDLGAYGSEIETPNLDALAASGMQFLDFHVSVACSPTRAMLMSGNDNHIAGLGAMGELLAPNQKGQPGYEGYLNDRVASLAEVLKNSGYHTYMTGKWHLGHSEGWYPYNRGFDQTFTMLVGAASHWNDMLGVYPADDPAKYARNGQPIHELPADFYSSRSYADMLMDMIRCTFRNPGFQNMTAHMTKVMKRCGDRAGKQPKTLALSLFPLNWRPCRLSCGLGSRSRTKTAPRKPAQWKPMPG